MTGASNTRPSEAAEHLRLKETSLLDGGRRAELGQFFTPSPVARLIASMLPPHGVDRIRLLDPGAGVGSLVAAAVEHYADYGLEELEIVAWEIDEQLHQALRSTLNQCALWASCRGLSVKWDLRGGDYIGAASSKQPDEFGADRERFDAIIMNPPYRKVSGGSSERQALMRIGLPITNLYTAFLALAARQLAPRGALAAITPRSFANGLYSAPFRQFFFGHVGIEQLHLFESRNLVFADTNVLQENIVFTARRDVKPKTVKLSISNGPVDKPRAREVPADSILRPDDPHLFLRIPSERQDAVIAETMEALPASLEDLEISVSTGKVVEFRASKYLRRRATGETAALVRPNHLRNWGIQWPDVTKRQKPNALAINPASEKLLLPNGAYVLVKRLTSKEERRRVCAAVADPSVIPGTKVAFENHLNVFHRNNNGLPLDCAYGLAAYLNSSFVDLYIRQFNGHTQINATDLRHLRYPSWNRIVELGIEIRSCAPSEQAELDEVVEKAWRGSARTPLQAVA